ncbi:MAG: flagellar hook-associated protein FlgK [Clostridia bacterium]|nr:flagellar hook-associated protein FlgK [Clostridia bacterium]
MSNFYGLELASKSLYASQKAIETTAHNIANVNTEGYSRQVVELEAVVNYNGLIYDSKNARNVGSGVVISNIEQVRNEFYDKLYRKEISISSELTSKNQAYSYIEEIMKSSSDSNITNDITSLFNSMEKLSLDSENMILREQVRQDAILLTDNLNTTAENLYQFQSQLNNNVIALTGQINDMANEVASLNDMIYKYELSGNKANDLRDQRNLLVDQISEKIGVTTSEGADGTFKVLINGFSLVDHKTVNQITLKQDITNPVTNEKYSSLYWGSTNTKVNIQSGEMKALTDMRDGNSVDRIGVNYIIGKLDNLAGSLVTEFNAINRAGYTLPYGSSSSETGIDFFNAANTHAFNISISSELEESGANIAASSQLISDFSNWGNNENLQSFMNLRESDSITFGSESIGDFESYIENTYTQISFATGFAASRKASQDSIVSYVTNQKDSVSGVNLDEEMLNLSRYQKSYQAAAKLMAVIDEMLQTLLNSF